MNYLTPEFIKDLETSKDEEMLETLTQEFKTMFPSRTRVLGKENLNLFLTHQQERAKHYNYVYYADLKRDALIAFYLGTYFDEDPLYPWVERILNEEESFGVKVDSLMENFQDYSIKTLGTDFIYFQKALESLNRIDASSIEKYGSYADIVKKIKYVYPERMKIIGEEHFRELLVNEKETVEKYGLHTPLGNFTYATVLFMLGSHVFKDPLYAWVGKYVNKAYEDKHEKARTLFEKGKSRVRKELMDLERVKEKGN